MCIYPIFFHCAGTKNISLKIGSFPAHRRLLLLYHGLKPAAINIGSLQDPLKDRRNEYIAFSLS